MLLNAADCEGYRLKSYLNSVLFRNVTHNNALQSNYNSQFYTSIKVKHNFANIKFFWKVKHTVYLHCLYLQGVEQWVRVIYHQPT